MKKNRREQLGAAIAARAFVAKLDEILYELNAQAEWLAIRLPTERTSKFHFDTGKIAAFGDGFRRVKALREEISEKGEAFKVKR